LREALRSRWLWLLCIRGGGVWYQIPDVWWEDGEFWMAYCSNEKEAGHFVMGEC
jgi:hypothetical protein